MYTLILDEGVIVKDSDQSIVSPSQSNQDPEFVAYVNWVTAGNNPTVIPTRTPTE